MGQKFFSGSAGRGPPVPDLRTWVAARPGGTGIFRTCDFSLAFLVCPWQTFDMTDLEKESKDLERAIAVRIRSERQKLGWTLERLAKVTGLSKGYLSQIENHDKTPAIGTLTKIAYGLGLDVANMISGAPPAATNQKITLVRGRERRSVIHANAAKNSLYDSFGFARPDRIMDPYIVSVSHEYPPKPLLHHGQEFTFTLEGRHEFYYDGQTYELGAGDAMYFDSDRPHMARSLSEKPARVLVVFCNPVERS